MASTLTAALKVPVVPDTAPLLTTEVALRAPVNVDTPETVILSVLTLRVAALPTILLPLTSSNPVAVTIPVILTPVSYTHLTLPTSDLV